MNDAPSNLMTGFTPAWEPYKQGTGNSRLASLVAARGGEAADATFLVDAADGSAVTFAGLATRVGALGRVLDERTRPGQPVALAMTEVLDYAVALVGIVAHGRRCVPLDPGAPPTDLARTLAVTRAGVIVTDRTDLEGVREGTTLIVPPAAAGGASAVEVPTGCGSAGAIVLATSGSTGTPKVVQLEESVLLHVAGVVAEHNRLGPDDVGYCTLPLFHVNAEVVALLASLLAGSRLVLRRRFSRRALWDDLDHAQVTWINAVPAILAILAGEQPRELPSLRFVRSASAPLPAPTRRRVEELLAVPVMESYGMTEAASQITVAPLDGSGPLGSAGRPAGVELVVRLRDGAPAPVGEVGRIWIRGPGVITAYVGEHGADRIDADGWLDTGDLGSLDPDGFLFLTGRSDDVINRGGEMVYPGPIEQVLLEDDRVREAVVVGAPHDVLGAVPEAFVIAAEGADTSGLAADLEQRCADNLSRPYRPVAFHVVDDLPRASTGKIVRRRIQVPARASAVS